MTRALFFLLFLTSFALAAVWFVDNDGQVVVEWMGYRVQTSIAFAILFLIIIIVTSTLFLQAILWVKSAPKRYSRKLKDRKFSRGMLALTKGFAAVAAGDKKQARTFSARASSNLENIPLTKLLAAQTAQLQGDRELVREHYTQMLENKDTEIIAIKGLLIEAKYDEDLPKALFLAEKAYKLCPDAEWVILILFDLYKKLKKWPDSLNIATVALKHKIISHDDADKTFALINFAIYEEMLRSGQNNANEFLNKAYKLLPDFIPIVAAYCRMLLARKETKKTLKIIEKKWVALPHPDLAALYMEIYKDDSDEKNLEKAEELLQLCAGHPEGHALVATYALEARHFGKARHHLHTALTFGENKNVCNMIAELETIERAGHELVNYWRERARNANEFSLWKCGNCGTISQIWSVTCNDCNEFDAMQWRNYQASANIVPAKTFLGKKEDVVFRG
jgi:HemY protein